MPFLSERGNFCASETMETPPSGREAIFASIERTANIRRGDLKTFPISRMRIGRPLPTVGSNTCVFRNQVDPQILNVLVPGRRAR